MDFRRRPGVGGAEYAMQVNLLTQPNTHKNETNAEAMLLSTQAGSFAPLLRRETTVLSNRLRWQDGWDSELSASGIFQGSTEAIKQSERDLDSDSRAFRRKVVREQASQQAQDRREYRAALNSKSGKSLASKTESTSASQTRSGSTETSSPPQATSQSPAKTTTAKFIPAASTPQPQPPVTRKVGSATRPMPASNSATASPDNYAHNALSHLRTASITTMMASSTGTSINSISAASSAQSSARPSIAGGPRGDAMLMTNTQANRGSSKTSTAFASKTASGQPADNADRTENIERIVRILASRINGKNSHTVMRLDPAELGSLRLQMDLRGEVMTLRVDTSTHLAHRLLSEEVEKLREGLEGAGVRLERIEVRPPADATQVGDQSNTDSTEPRSEQQEGSEQAGAEQPAERGENHRSAGSFDDPIPETDPEPVAESLVNVIA